MSRRAQLPEIVVEFLGLLLNEAKRSPVRSNSQDWHASDRALAVAMKCGKKVIDQEALISKRARRAADLPWRVSVDRLGRSTDN